MATRMGIFDPASERWRLEAACRDTDPQLFFPTGTTGPAAEAIAHAKSICAICPVRRPCLEYALRTQQDNGIWGGLSEEERRSLRETAGAGELVAS